jgi:hypothetical protein
MRFIKETSVFACDDLLSPAAPTHVAVMWNGIAQNIVGRSTEIWIIVRSSGVAQIAIVVAVKVPIFRGRVPSRGHTILGYGQRDSAEQQGRR